MSDYTPTTDRFGQWLREERLAQHRFWTCVSKKENGCWGWIGHKATNGYGRINIDKKSQAAHRVAYEWLRAPIPDGLELDHLCRNRACVNPDHLEPVTHRENTLRGNTITSKAAQTTHCPRGHALIDGNLVPSSLKQGRRDCLTCSRDRARERRASDVRAREIAVSLIPYRSTP